MGDFFRIGGGEGTEEALGIGEEATPGRKFRSLSQPVGFSFASKFMQNGLRSLARNQSVREMKEGIDEIEFGLKPGAKFHRELLNLGEAIVEAVDKGLARFTEDGHRLGGEEPAFHFGAMGRELLVASGEDEKDGTQGGKAFCFCQRGQKSCDFDP